MTIRRENQIRLDDLDVSGQLDSSSEGSTRVGHDAPSGGRKNNRFSYGSMAAMGGSTRSGIIGRPRPLFILFNYVTYFPVSIQSCKLMISFTRDSAYLFSIAHFLYFHYCFVPLKLHGKLAGTLPCPCFFHLINQKNEMSSSKKAGKQTSRPCVSHVFCSLFCFFLRFIFSPSLFCSFFHARP